MHLHIFLFQEKDGKPYQARHTFTCKAQADGFKELLTTMANKPQDYVTPSGRMTTNTVEGFHGLALMYRGKQTDLEHTHYTCKTDMAVCHKVYRQLYLLQQKRYKVSTHYLLSFRMSVRCGRFCAA